MYSAKVTADQIEKVESRLNLKLKRYDIGVCLDRADDLKKRDAMGKKAPELKPEFKKFIQNEQILCKLDFNYWSERYCRIIRDGVDGGGIGNLNVWESQKVILALIGKLEELAWEAFARGEPVDGILIALNKARQLGACLVAGTKVLTADLRWVPIEDIKTGQEIVSFDENSSRPHKSRELRRATVLATCSMEVPTVKLTLSDGTVFQGTPHHKFLCAARGGTNLKWVEMRHMRPGDKIRRIMKPWPRGEGYEDGWFAGFLDGEGSCRSKNRGGAEICGSQVEGSVLRRAVSYLDSNGYSYRVEADRRKAGDSSKLGNQVVYKLVVNRMADIFRLIGQTRPSRFLNAEWYVGKEMSKDGESYAEVVSVEMAGIQRVYDIQTTTGTYVAEGFASHNTMICRAIIQHRLTLYDHTRGFSASVDEDKVLELYDRDVRILDNLPRFLQPQAWGSTAGGANKKGEHIHFAELDSGILYQHGRQQSGLGQGRQFEVSHITEAASFAFPKMLEHDYFPTIPQSPWAFCLAESTPQGRGNWWHQWSEKVRLGRMARWHYLFVPVYIERKKYRRTPPANWIPSPLTLKRAQKVEETSPRVIGYKFIPERDHLYWWESTRQEYSEMGSLAIFLTNYADTPEDSFQFSTSASLPVDLLQKLRLDTTEPVSYEFQRS